MISDFGTNKPLIGDASQDKPLLSKHLGDIDRRCGRISVAYAPLLFIGRSMNLPVQDIGWQCILPAILLFTELVTVVKVMCKTREKMEFDTSTKRIE